jgi:hypothetical protein
MIANPIIASTGGGTKAPIGLYPATLESVQPVQKKKYESEEMETRIEFKFKLTGPDGKTYTMWKDFYPSNNTKHTLYLFVVSMTGQVVEPAVISNADAWWAYVQSLAGKNFMVQVAPTQTGKTKIGSAFPSANQAPVAPAIGNDQIEVDPSIVPWEEDI